MQQDYRGVDYGGVAQDKGARRGQLGVGRARSRSATELRWIAAGLQRGRLRRRSTGQGEQAGVSWKVGWARSRSATQLRRIVAGLRRSSAGLRIIIAGLRRLEAGLRRRTAEEDYGGVDCGGVAQAKRNR